MPDLGYFELPHSCLRDNAAWKMQSRKLSDIAPTTIEVTVFQVLTSWENWKGELGLGESVAVRRTTAAHQDFVDYMHCSDSGLFVLIRVNIRLIYFKMP
jgi:hypothetical protein